MQRDLADFLAAVRVAVPREFGLRLRGSWANDEFHLIRNGGRLRSRSDVDYVCSEPLHAAVGRQVKATLGKAASASGLAIGVVSVRAASEIADMWESGGRWSLLTAGHRSQFVLFWAMIGAADLNLAVARTADADIQSTAQYHLNKWFLNVWRDLAIVRGQKVRTYRDILQFASGDLPDEVLATSFALKLGLDAVVPWRVMGESHQRALDRAILDALPKKPAEEMRRLVDFVAAGGASARGVWNDLVVRAAPLGAHVPGAQAALRRVAQKSLEESR